MGAWEDYNCWIVRRFYVAGVGYIVEYQCLCPTDSIGHQTQIKEPYTKDELNTDVIRLMKNCPTPEAKGQIIAHNINKWPCPDCGSAKEGQEIEVIAGMKNVGEVEGEFRFYIYDQDGNELSKEPDYSYKNVKPGDTWGVSKTLTTNLNFDMPNKTLNGVLKLVRQT